MGAIDHRLAVGENDVDGPIRAAQWIWELSGSTVRCVAGWEQGIQGALEIPESVRMEVIIADDSPAGVWSSLLKQFEGTAWTMGIVVPQYLMGRAHENLHGTGWDLQSWWISDGRVSFGSVERA